MATLTLLTYQPSTQNQSIVEFQWLSVVRGLSCVLPGDRSYGGGAESVATCERGACRGSPLPEGGDCATPSAGTIGSEPVHWPGPLSAPACVR